MSLIRGDALTIPLADNTVDLIVTSPPYFALRSYTDACPDCAGSGQTRPRNTKRRTCHCGWEGNRTACAWCGNTNVPFVEEPSGPCLTCEGKGGEHYAGQLGSEATPAAFIDALVSVTRECVRVLKPSGSLFVNLGDKYNSGGGHGKSSPGVSAREGRKSHDDWTGRPGKTLGDMPTKSLMGLPWRYALRCIDDLGLILRAEIIWSKPNGLPESVQDLVRRSHEQWFHFTLEPRYYSAVDEIREPHVGGGVGVSTEERKANGWAPNRGTASGTEPMVTFAGNHLGKLPGSVWTVPTEPLRVPDDLPQHFAAFPSEWPRRIVLGWSPEEGTVLDPFAGTGTSVAVANALGRHGIGIDLSADYLRLARWRCQDPGLRAKVLRVDKPAPEVPGQMALL